MLTSSSSSSSAVAGQEDLTLLTNLTERSINDNLKVRFNRDLIYTNIGNVLLSVNPYKPIPFLYDTELIEFYKLGGKERSVANVLTLQRKMREKIVMLLESKAPTGGSTGARGMSLHQRFRSRIHVNDNSGSGGAAAVQAMAITQIRQNKALMASLTGGGGGDSGAGSGPGSTPLAQVFPHLAGGPHVFQLANAMFHALLTEEENQTVIISGESGAGKTEASKQIINFISCITDHQRAEALATAGGNGSSGAAEGGASEDPTQEGGDVDTIEKIKNIILESNPLMEAFGNAKTVKNDNSSRFGKFFEIYFPKSDDSRGGGGGDGGARDPAPKPFGLPVGGHMSIFLLEKSRVVQQQFGERNFHIFYQLIAGLEPEAKRRLRLDAFERPGAARGRPITGKPFFRYLNSGRTTTIDRVDDAVEFAKTRQAMGVVGISDTVQGYIFEVLAVILHLGELDFVDAHGNTGSGDDDEDGTGSPAVTGSGVCRVQNPETLQFIASLLHLDDPAGLEKALTVKTLEIGEKSNVTGGGGARRNVQVLEVPLDLAECRNNRNAVAKLLYDAVFNFIVYFINNALKSASAVAQRGRGGAGLDDPAQEDVLFRHYADNMRQENLLQEEEANAEQFLMLGVLDIYGFEIFANNSFEQLCINYINEKLHQIFIDLTLKKEQEEYESESIVLPEKIDSYFDNKRILDVIEGTAAGSGGEGDAKAAPIPGIFQLLDDVCVSLAKEPEHVADAKFLEKLDMFLASSPAAAPFFQKSEKNGFFTVKHYAGNVMYNVNGFVTKNKDKLSNTILEELRKSGNIFVSEILAPTMFLLDEEEEQNLRNRQLGTSSGAAKKRNIFMSAGKKIREQADRLVQKLRSSNIHYIRTIKPNEEKKSDLFVDECVLHQIQYLGLMENVQIRKMGFIYRNYFDVFLRRFYLLFSLMNERMRRGEYSPYHTSTGGSHNGNKRALLAVSNGDVDGGYGYVEPYNFLEHDDKESCQVLLTFVESEVVRCQQHQPQPGQGKALKGPSPSDASSRMGFDKDCWQLGSTKVFIRQPTHLFTLERLREACVEGKVRKIQTCYRKYRGERTHVLLKQRMARLYKRGGKARRADSVFRTYSGDYLDIKNSARCFAFNQAQNHRDLLRLLRFDPIAYGWREFFSQRDGKFYYVNVLTGESQWTKPAAMVEAEMYSDGNAAEALGSVAPQGKSGAPSSAAVPFTPINTEGVQVLFSAKVERVSLHTPIPFGACNTPDVANYAVNGVGFPYSLCDECIVVVTNKVLCLFREVVTRDESAAGEEGAAAPRATHAPSPTQPSVPGRPSWPLTYPTSSAPAIQRPSPAEPDPTATSEVILVKRIDLRLLRAITVSPYADDFLFIHVYPQLEPSRPVYLSQSSPAVGATEGGGEAPDTKRASHATKSKKVRPKRDSPEALPPPPTVLCDCCRRPLPPTAPRAHCPCCGRLCCLRTCLNDRSPLDARQHRPLPTLLGSNVVNPDVLATVATGKARRLKALAAQEAQRLKQQQAAAKQAAKKATKGGAAATLAAATSAVSEANIGGDGDVEENHVLTVQDLHQVECVLVCPWCVHVEPREINEDLVVKTFVRTELAAFLLRAYKQHMGFDLPFYILKDSDGSPDGATAPSVQLSLAVNKGVERRVIQASIAAAGGGEHVSADADSRLLAALMAGSTASTASREDKQLRKDASTRKRLKGKRAATPPAVALPAEAESSQPMPFSSYQTVTVICTERPKESDGGLTDERSEETLTWASGSRAFAPSLVQYDPNSEDCTTGPSVFFGPLTLTTSAPPGLPKSVIATIEARREERRRAHEQRRREEAAMLRDKAHAKAQEREEAYARLVEEKKRERKEREVAERNARLWKEEEQRQRREAAARLVAEKAKRGL